MLPVIEDLIVDRILLGRILRAARDSLGQTVRGIADAAWLTSSHISKIELGQVQVSAENLVRICSALGLPVGLVLESCTFVNKGAYWTPSFNDPEVSRLADAIMSGDRRTRQRIAEFLAGTAACAWYILKSSNPEDTLQRLSFPVQAQAERFKEFATRIENGMDVVDRNIHIVNIAMGNLQGLVELEDIKEYVALYDQEKSGIELPWSPHPSPAFFADDIPKENPNNRDLRIMLASHIQFEKLRATRKKELLIISESGNIASVKSRMAALLNRLKLATGERGKKSALAKSLGVPLTSVSQWLSGEREPGGETTLRLLQWLEEQERQKT